MSASIVTKSSQRGALLVETPAQCYVLEGLMRIPLARLFARNPLTGLGAVMERVLATAGEVPELVEHLIAGDQAKVIEQARKISQLEGLADEAKNEVRSKMPLRLLLPVDRRDVLRLLSQIDSIADSAEDVAVLLTLRKMEVPSSMTDLLRGFTRENVACVKTAGKLVEKLPVLLETAFGGRVAEEAFELIDQIAREEHEADKLQDQLAKALFRLEGQMSPIAIMMWMRIFEEIGDMSNHAENVGDQFRLFLAQ